MCTSDLLTFVCSDGDMCTLDWTNTVTRGTGDKTSTHTHTDANTQNRWRNRLVQCFNIQNCPGKSSNQTITNWLLKKRKTSRHTWVHIHTHTYTHSHKTPGLLCRQATCSLHHRALWSASDKRINLKLGEQEREGRRSRRRRKSRGRAHWGLAVPSILSCYCKLSGEVDRRMEGNIRKKRKKSKREHWLKSLSRPLVVQPEAR